MKKNNLSVNLVVALLVAVMVLPLLAACNVDTFEGGKEALFSDEYRVQTLLGQRLSSDEFKDYESYITKALDPDTVFKSEFEFKIQELEIEEGITLNDSNYINGTIYSSKEKSEGTIDLSFMGQGLSSGFYYDGEQVVLEFPELMEEYLVIPFSEFIEGDILGDVFEPAEKNSNSIEIFGDYATIMPAFEDIVNSFVDTLKEEIPDENVITTKETVEYINRNVEADVITVELSNENLKTIVTKFFEDLKDNEEIASLAGEDFGESIDSLLEEIEENDSDSNLKYVATYVDSALVMWDLELKGEEDTANISYEYISQTTETGTFDKTTLAIKDSEDVNIEFILEGDSITDTYAFSIVDASDYTEYFNLSMTFLDDGKIGVSMEVEELVVNLVMDLEITENSSEITCDIEFAYEDLPSTAKFSASAKYEIIDSYDFKTPDVNDENSFDVTDEDDLESFIDLLSESALGELIGGIIGSDQEPVERNIEFDYETVLDTQGELLVENFSDAYDGNGAVDAASDYGMYISYAIDDDQIAYYCVDVFNNIEDQFYCDGEQWYAVDDFEETLEVRDEVLFYLPEMLLMDEAEFVGSGLVYVDEVEYTYEVFYFPTFETQLYFMYENDGDTILVADDYDIYTVTLSDEIDFDMFYDVSSYDVISQT